jgi:uncharacterized protein (TIGR03000 family)
MRALTFTTALGLLIFGTPLAQAAGEDAPVVITMLVPSDAQVWFNGTKTTQTGSQRRFYSPPLTAGRTYSYEIRIFSDSQDLIEKRTLQVRSGDRITLDLRGAEVRESRADSNATYRAPTYDYGWSQPRVSSFADQSPFGGYSWSPWGLRQWNYLTIGPFDNPSR